MSKKIKKRTEKRDKSEIYKKWPNGKLIYESMKNLKIKGDPRDFVIFNGDTILDYRGFYNVYRDTNDTVVRIVHKKNLKKIIGEENAKRFWHPTFGRLVDIKVNKNVNKKKS
jgi:hypothetical protein